MKIYMFHYVTENFNYYHFDKNEFEKKIKILATTKKIIGLKELNEAIKNKCNLDDNYIMLTFDDATIDHYKYVYPILKKYNAKGVFFLCSNIFKKEILDIHFIHKLFSVVSEEKIYNEINKYIKNKNIYIQNSNSVKKSFNSKETYIKFTLQTLLPEEDRRILIDMLVKKYNISFEFKDYYMSIENILEMKDNKMEFGCHTNTHKRLGFLDYNEQVKEISDNLKNMFQYKILKDKDVISIAYPFGNYNEDSLKILKQLNIDLAFTTEEKDNIEIDKYKIARYDCNRLKEKNEKIRKNSK